MPKFVDTGNPEADRERYRQAKLEWVAKNPEKYKNMKPQPVRKITRKDFDKLPESRQRQILAHPEQYKIVEETH